MTHRRTRQFQMLLRVREFGETYGERFSEDTLAAAAFRAIGEAVNLLNTHVVDRLAVRQQSAGARAEARAALIAKMEIMSRTARVLRAEDPSFMNTFLMPERQSAEAVLTAARLFLRDIEPHAAKFKAHGFGATFPADFQQLLQRFEAVIDEREAAKADTAASRERIETAIASGFAAARKLDILVTNVLRDDSVALVEWRRSRRVGYPAVKEPGGTAAPGGSSTAASPAPPNPPLPKGESPIDDAVETASEATPVEVNVNASDNEAVSEADEEAA